jgi:trk system potassium uptake protein TrkA
MAEVKGQRVVILGCGRVGSTLARQLAVDGYSVTVVDSTADSFRRLGPKFRGNKVIGNGLDQDTMRKAGVENVNTFIAVTQGDNTNIMAVQIAREVFGAKRVVARLYDPIRAQAYREMGIVTLCTTTVAAGLIRATVCESTECDELRAKVESWDMDYLEQVG